MIEGDYSEFSRASVGDSQQRIPTVNFKNLTFKNKFDDRPRAGEANLSVTDMNVKIFTLCLSS